MCAVHVSYCFVRVFFSQKLVAHDQQERICSKTLPAIIFPRLRMDNEDGLTH